MGWTGGQPSSEGGRHGRVLDQEPGQERGERKRSGGRSPGPGWRLTTVDRCDRCGAQAYVRVLLPGRLELLFCAHHNRQYSPALVGIAVEIQDETIRLACCALSGIRIIPIPGPPIAPRDSRARQPSGGPRRLQDLVQPCERQLSLRLHADGG
jgi:hypothetical protein